MNEFHVHISGPKRGPIPATFEEAEFRLTQLPKLYFEADGSFVWARDGGRQQMYGMVYDAQGAIQYCELRGKCSLDSWRLLCEAIGGELWAELEILVLPEGKLQNLQSFEQRSWPNGGQTAT